MESAWGETIYTKTLKDSAEEQNIEWKNQGRRKREPCCFLSSFFAFLLDRHWIVEANIWLLISFTLELHEYGTAAWLLNTSVWDLSDLMKLEDLEEERVQVRVKVCHKKKKNTWKTKYKLPYFIKVLFWFHSPVIWDLHIWQSSFIIHNIYWS